MKIILTHDGTTLNSNFIGMIQPVFIDTKHDTVLDNLTDEIDCEEVEFGIVASTFLYDEVVLATYATEEERDYAKYKLELWLSSECNNFYTMNERK